MQRLIIPLLFTSYLSLHAGNDREFIFDIHDAASSTEQYANEAVIVPVYNNLTLSDDFAGVLPDFYSTLPALLKAHSFNPASHDIATFSDTDSAGNAFTIIASGLGVKTDALFSLEDFRRCFAQALCEAEKNNIEKVHIALPTCIDSTMKEIAQDIAAIAYTALYEYTALSTTKPMYKVKHICVHAHMHTPNDFKDVNIGLRIGSNLGTSICQAREWVNTPSHLMTPTTFANDSAQYILPFIAKIETIIFEKEDVTRMGMGGLLGAAQGSEQPCTFVVHYLKCRYPNVPTIALISNGIISDMHRSTSNISGAAAIFAALNIIAYRNIPANIVVLTPLVTPAHNDAALKTGTVLSMANRSTVEVTDPHAIGQLMLADAITHAITHYHPDYIIDIAPLTDGCRQTFGGCYAAMMCNNDNFIAKAQQAGIQSGELVWQLPLSDAYAARLQSQIATLSNASHTDPTAQTPIAGCFLQHFVGDIPWLHIDIAGTKKDSAFGVRLLVDLVESLAKKTQS